jgi:hypothetical protein
VRDLSSRAWIAKSEYSKRKRLSRSQLALGDDVNLMSWDEEKLPRSRADDDEKEMLLLLLLPLLWIYN